MIGLILGTSEGKRILSLLNKYTTDILISTATQYGGEELSKYNYKQINKRPLNYGELLEILKANNITMLVDASHPYAEEITKNAVKVCEELNIEYIRYERPSSIRFFEGNKNIITVESYEELEDKLNAVKGNVLNTTGSKNIKSIISYRIENRIIHRVLPSSKVLEECINLGVKVEDIIAIKGPVGMELNKAFIKEYNAAAMILKDSGIEGGTVEKLNACIEMGIYAFVIKRKSAFFKDAIVFESVEETVKYILEKII